MSRVPFIPILSTISVINRGSSNVDAKVYEKRIDKIIKKCRVPSHTGIVRGAFFISIVSSTGNEKRFDQRE